MKKNITTTILVLTILTVFSFGCGMLGGNKLSNEQISDDLISKGVIEKNGASIDLAGAYSSHCFQVKDSKFSSDTGEVNLFMSATEVLRGGDNIKVVIGDISLTYKKDGEKWKLENVNPTNFDVKTVSMTDAMTKFAPLSKPICAVYSRPYNASKKN